MKFRLGNVKFGIKSFDFLIYYHVFWADINRLLPLAGTTFLNVIFFFFSGSKGVPLWTVKGVRSCELIARKFPLQRKRKLIRKSLKRCKGREIIKLEHK